MPFDDIYLEYYQRCFLFAKSYLQDEMLSKDIASLRSDDYLMDHDEDGRGEKCPFFPDDRSEKSGLKPSAQ